MDLKFVVTLAEEIIAGTIPGNEKYKALLDIPDHDVFTLISGSDIIRDFYFGRGIHLCTICNCKSGRCSEDCHFCSQSRFFETDTPVYSLMEKSNLQQGGLSGWAGSLTEK